MSSSSSQSTGQCIVEQLKTDILAAKYPPGARLPTRVELERRFGTTPVTMQRVFDTLSREGLVVSRGRLGTFVSRSAPHLTRYVLVFPYRNRPQRPWPQFWVSLAAEAGELVRTEGRKLSFSYGNETHEDVEAYRELVEEVTTRQLAGLIFASRPFYLAGSPLLTEPGLPRVAIMNAASMGGVKAVALSGDVMGALVRELVRAGRRRIAVVTPPDLERPVQEALQRARLATRPYWVQLASYSAPQAARRAVHLLMSARPEERPDGLMVADDNLLSEALAGLADAGMRVPEDVSVAAHGNFPRPTPASVPVPRVGHDVGAVLRACVDILDRQRRGEASPDLVEVSAVGVDGANRPLGLAVGRNDR